jgi:hypothetical protein
MPPKDITVKEGQVLQSSNFINERRRSDFEKGLFSNSEENRKGHGNRFRA